jgi:Nif-specific regulatory protein
MHLKKIEETVLLYEISRALTATLDLRKSLYKVLGILCNSMDMIRATISILNP